MKKSEVEKIVDNIEFLSNVNHNDRPSYNVHQRYILERRWHVYKFILLGIHNEAENNIALGLCEHLMNVSNSKHENEKDTWLLNQLVEVIMTFEAKAYPIGNRHINKHK